MNADDFDCPYCHDIGLRQVADADAVRLICPRCKRIAAVKWLDDDPDPPMRGQMSLRDYPETAA